MRDQISTTVTDVTKTVNENYTETNDRVLDAVVENSRKVVEFAVKTADQLPELPFSDRVPTAAEAGDRYMEFVERLVEMNRDFSDRVVKMNRDYTDRVVKMLEEEAPKPAAKPAAKKATKPAAKKTTKKAAASK